MNEFYLESEKWLSDVKEFDRKYLDKTGQDPT